MINRGSILFAACAALMLAACGGDDEAAREDAAPAETAPAPETAEAAPEEPLDIPAEDRAQLVEACVADTGNSEVACECAADQAAERLDGRVYAFFSAKLAGNDDRADDIMGQMTLSDLQDTATTMQVIFVECQLNLPD